MAGVARFAGGDILGRLNTKIHTPRRLPPAWADPWGLDSKLHTLTPADFRLDKGSPGQGAGPGGKDLGADVDLVGPGAAYEKWKQTPEYQEWRKSADDALR